DLRADLLEDRAGAAAALRRAGQIGVGHAELDAAADERAGRIVVLAVRAVVARAAHAGEERLQAGDLVADEARVAPARAPEDRLAVEAGRGDRSTVIKEVRIAVATAAARLRAFRPVDAGGLRLALSVLTDGVEIVGVGFGVQRAGRSEHESQEHQPLHES